ncbi:MAG TPA: thermonuclease family protein [Noviherbaspirillum sp.]|nr:thermonuclease family protein [Noviherbaspirillum sp.]
MKAIILALALTLPVAATSKDFHAHPVSAFGPVVGISDGDTMTVLTNGRQILIRLANIDVPEKAQPFGQKPKQSLSDLCWKKEARYKAQNLDRYERTVAKVWCDDVEVNREQVALGMAWVYPKYNRDASVLEIQQSAKVQRRGLWTHVDPIPPWEFRAAIRTRSKR